MPTTSITPIPCDSQISEVTVYARGALIRRRLQLPERLPDGEVELRAAGVTPLLEPGSLRARLLGEGPARTVLQVRSALHVPEGSPIVGESVEEVRALTARIERLQAEQARLAAQRKRLVEQPVDPRIKAQSPLERIGDRIDDALACLSVFGEIAAELDVRLCDLGQRLRLLEEEREAAALRDAQARSAARMGAGHPRRDLLVRLGGHGPVQGLEVSYVVQAARFWPIYTLRLSEGGRRAELMLEALVAQLSGEDWRGVRLGLSTADLLYDARLPELPSLRWGRAQQRARRDYRPAPEGLERMFAGYDRVFGAGRTAAPVAALLPEDASVEEEILAEDTGRYGAEAARPISFDEPGADEESSGVRGGQGRDLPQTSRGSLTGSPPGAPRELSGEPQDPSDRSVPWGSQPGAPGIPPPRPLAAPAPPVMMSLALPAAGPASGAAPPARPAGLIGGTFGAAQKMAKGFGGGVPGGPHQAAAPLEAPEALAPDDAWLDYDALLLGGPEDPRRGRLLRQDADQRGAEARAASARIESLSPPTPGAEDPRQSRGRFDHRYDADGLCEVASDGLCHRVTIGTAEAEPRARFRAVPRETPEVYREVELQNPFAAPLLGGPVDVYVEGSLLLQTCLGPIDRGGVFTIGMGVEERLRVARNARSEEESAGVLGGSTAVTSTVSIEVSSALGRDVIVEILDRLPVTDDKAVEVRRLSMRPEGEPYKQAERGAPVRGGWLWRLPVPAGKKAQVEFSYRVTLPAKSEIVGGNRRE